MEPKIKIRFAEKADLPSIVNIYNQAIRSHYATGDISEFTVEQRVTWFEKFDNDFYPLYLVEINGIVLGYCSLSPYRPGREAMATVAEISYYIDFLYHGKGLGSRLLEYVIADCKRINKESLLAILMDINPKSIGILKKFGFEKWGHFPDIIHINGEKAGHLVYGLRLNKK